MWLIDEFNQFLYAEFAIWYPIKYMKKTKLKKNKKKQQQQKKQKKKKKKHTQKNNNNPPPQQKQTNKNNNNNNKNNNDSNNKKLFSSINVNVMHHFWKSEILSISLKICVCQCHNSMYSHNKKSCACYTPSISNLFRNIEQR